MKFIRNQLKNNETRSNTTTNTERKIQEKGQKVQLSSYFKLYLQSYLKWLYEQNPVFAENLTDDEIVNFLLQNIELPVWLQVYAKVNPFRCMTEIVDYVKKYKRNARLMEYEYPIRPSEQVKEMTQFETVVCKKPYSNATENQVNNLRTHCSKVHIDGLMLNKVTTLDVQLLYFILSAIKNKRM